MKKLMRNAVCFILGAAFGIGCFILISRYSAEKRGADTFGGDNNKPPVSAQYEGGHRNSGLVQLAYSVASCLRDMDFETLSGYVNPEYGLILSPYPNINLASNRCMMPGKVSEIAKDDEIYVWGTKDGTDEPIQMTAGDYFSQYVYDRDYLSAPIVSINRTVKSGNSLENVQTVFPEGQYLDFYIPPSSEEALDWSILRLVFEDYNGTLKLSAIIHSQYTV